jgi:hypothetical protein
MQTEMNTYHGCVCPICERPIPTGFYFVRRDIATHAWQRQLDGKMAETTMVLVPRRLHPSCAALNDLLT